jgi:hypothetical protein
MGEVIRQFLSGAGSILDIYPERRPAISRPDFMRVSDSERIKSDWLRVGGHLQNALSKVTEEANRGASK